MTTKRKARSRILDAVHKTASDLHRLGFTDKRKVVPRRPLAETDIRRAKAFYEAVFTAPRVGNREPIAQITGAGSFDSPYKARRVRN